MANRTWSGLGADNLASTPGNWDTTPITGDACIFPSGTKACTWDLNISPLSFNLQSGYANAVTMARNLVLTGGITLTDGTLDLVTFDFTCTTVTANGGTWTQGSGAVSTGAVTFSGGGIGATSATWTITGGSFTQTNSPTFNANGGVISFTGLTSRTLTAPNCAFNRIAINGGNSSAAFTVAAGTTCPLGTNPTIQSSFGAAFTCNGDLSWTDRLTVVGNFTISSSSVVTVSGTKTMTARANVTWPAGSTVTTGIEVLWGSTASSTVDCPGYSFGTCVVNKDSSGLNVIVSNGTTIPLGTNPTIGSSFGCGLIVNSGGAVTWTGTATFVGLFTVNSGGVATVSGTPVINIRANLTFASGSAVTSGIPVNFNSTAASVVDCPGYSFGTCTIQKSANVAVTIQANTTIPLGNNPNTFMGTNTLTLNGTITATGTWSHSGGAAFALGATGVISGTVNLVITNAAFTGTAGGQASGTTVTMTFTTSTGRTFAGAGITFAGLVRAGSGSGALTITGTNTFGFIEDSAGSVAHTITFPNVTTTLTGARPFTVVGSSGRLVTLQRTGASGVFTLNATNPNASIVCDFISVTNSTVDVTPEWYAGANSTIGSGCTNWLAGNAPTQPASKRMGGVPFAQTRIIGALGIKLWSEKWLLPTLRRFLCGASPTVSFSPSLTLMAI